MVFSFQVGENPRKLGAHAIAARILLRLVAPSEILSLSGFRISEESCFNSVARFGGLSSLLVHSNVLD
jgi:hypothetical protein